MTQDEAFQQLDEELKLNPEEVDHARSFPDRVREALAAGGVEVDHSFLQGSLARGTMASPFKDIDMVVTLELSNHGDLREDPDGPDQAMDLLEEALDEHLRDDYPGLSFPSRSRHALKIDLGEDLPTFDLVPGFELTPDEPDDIEIANRDDGTWDWSNPRELRRVVAERNQATGGRLIHVVRMGKHAAQQIHENFPGLVVESIACEALREEMSFAEGCTILFEAAAEMLGGDIFEPTWTQQRGSKDRRSGTRPHRASTPLVR